MSTDDLFESPEAELNLDNTPDLGDFDDSFDFDNADLGGDMIGALPGDHAEKRKSRDEGGADEGGDSKRQETEDGEKSAKKPGRKPLTTEPTTKRKAQNRAAQRAFRERKEKHLKDLETQVTELTKAQEADKHENGLLKAQVERLQVELREYRKRLSLNSTRTNGGSPPLKPTNTQQKNINSSSSFNSGFQFDFPKFGGLPGSQIFGTDNFGTNTNNATPRQTTRSPSGDNATARPAQQQPGFLSRENSAGRSLSPRNSQSYQTTSASDQLSGFDPAFTSYSTTNNMHGFASMLPQMNDAPHDDTFGGLFSPSILKSVGNVNSTDTNYFNSQRQNSQPLNTTEYTSDFGTSSNSGYNRAFQFNSNSSISGISDSASPASSMSQWNNNNANSSCGTSPEPAHDSPANKDKPQESFGDKTLQHDQSGKQQTFQNINTTNFLSQADFNVPSLDSFDPVLFGDYRDSNDAIVGGGDFTGGFFNEALEPFDYSSPSNLFGILQSPQQPKKQIPDTSVTQKAPSKQCLEACDKIRDGGDDDYGLPTTQPAPAKQTQNHDNINLISCNSIWNQLQANTDFQEGKFDLDSLCSELRSKARCSESGVMVDQNHVDAALRKLGKKDVQRNEIPPGLMFEQESWDKVLQKMNNHQQ